METLKQVPYTELQIGDIVELINFQEFDYYWDDLIKPNSFEIYYELSSHKTLNYCVQFKHPDKVKQLYTQISVTSDEEEFSKLIDQLNLEKLTILSRQILKEV